MGGFALYYDPNFAMDSVTRLQPAFIVAVDDLGNEVAYTNALNVDGPYLGPFKKSHPGLKPEAQVSEVRFVADSTGRFYNQEHWDEWGYTPAVNGQTAEIK